MLCPATPAAPWLLAGDQHHQQLALWSRIGMGTRPPLLHGVYGPM